MIIPMKKILLILPLLLFLVPFGGFSQTSPLEDYAVEAFIEGVENIAVSVIQSAFTPMSDYEEGDLLFIASPGYFTFDQVYKDPEVSTDDGSGYTFGAGAGYAVSDRVLLYGILSGLSLNGTLDSEFYGSGEGNVSADLSFLYFSLFTGAGYEVLESRYLNIPVFAGLNCGYYSLQADMDPYIAGPVTTTVSLDGSGMLAGVSGGIAADIHIGGVSLVPYYLYMMNFNGTELDARISAKNGMIPLGSLSESHNVDPYRGGMLGFSAGYRMKSGWGFSFSLKNLLPLFEDDSDDANDMTSIIFAVSYAN